MLQNLTDREPNIYLGKELTAQEIVRMQDSS